MQLRDHQEAGIDLARREVKCIPLEMEAEQYDKLQELCDILKMPVQTFIQEAIQERLKLIQKVLIDQFNVSLKEEAGQEE